MTSRTQPLSQDGVPVAGNLASWTGYGVLQDSGIALPATYTVGDILYAPTGTTIGGLHDVAVYRVLKSGGVGVAPAWGDGSQAQVAQLSNAGSDSTLAC